jgi:hypothetical protein
MPTRNQLIIRGNKHTSIATNNFLDATGTWAIATNVELLDNVVASWPQAWLLATKQIFVATNTDLSQHFFHRGINTNLLQRMLQQKQPTSLVAIRPIYRNQLKCSLL